MESRDYHLYTTIERPYAKINRAYSCIYFGGILGLIYYRIVYMPSEGYFQWILVFCAELGFAFHWVLDQAMRWRPVDRYTFPERLSSRFENDLPPIDVFICTADPIKEPPIDVVNTLLSTLAFDYPVEKLSCYVSDDGGSPLTFYALYEASRFAKIWVPFCKKYSIKQRCPEVFFSEYHENLSFLTEWEKVKKMYEEMKYYINSTVERGTVPEHKCNEHQGFREWNPEMTSREHPSIVQVLLEKGKGIDDSDNDLPSLVYVSREKRPGYPHNFKAGALNVLIRVSSVISNAPFILTLDCDMYANNCEALREAMCFFMDPQTGHQFGYVQFPQRFHGITKNDLYANHLRTLYNIHHKGLDGIEGPLYVGTGCLLRRDVLCGSELQQYISTNLIKELIPSSNLIMEKAIPSERLDEGKELARYNYEENTLWGKKVGMLYDCACEDVVTGFAIQCRGWKSVSYTPTRDAFVGCAPVNLNDTLTQNKRWATGLLEILASKFSPFTYGIRHTSIAQNMAYSHYCLWATSSLQLVCYGSVPALCMLSGLSLFPQISNPWFPLFAFLSACAYAYNAIEYICVGGGSLTSWWNEQRMWMIKGVSSYLFGLIQVLSKLLGISKVGFEVTSKVLDGEAAKRYEAEIFEFGVTSVLFIPFSVIALINLMALMGGIAGVIRNGYPAIESMLVQLIFSSFIVVNSCPIYEGMFARQDKGKMPTSITIFSIMAATVLCSMASFISWTFT